MNNAFPIVRLGNYTQQISSRNHTDLEIEVFSVTNSEGFKRSTDYFSKEVFSKNLKNYKVVLPGEFAYNPSRINVGSIDFLKQDNPVLVSPLYIVFKCNESLSPEYLLKYLKGSLGNSQVRANTQGAVRDSLKYSGLENIKIPLPSLPEQIRIATLLSKVETLIIQRKTHLQQLDTLLKRIFLDLFGDPIKNEKGWEKKQLSELLEKIESGDSPKCEGRSAVKEEWGVLKLSAITRCSYDETQNKALPSNLLPPVSDEIRAGDLLFTRKNTYELVAACAYIFKTRSKLLIPDLIFRLVFKEGIRINKIFIWKLLCNESQRKFIQALATGAAGSMPNISKANLKTVQLPIPPFSLQNHFAKIVEKAETLKTRYEQSLADLETLYTTLSQKAFSGTLDLSRINPE